MSEPSQSPSLPDRFRRLSWQGRLAVIVGGAVALVFVFGAVNGPQDAGPERVSRSDSRAAVELSASAAATPDGQIGEGVWLVGSDVEPGTYRSAGATDGDYCMWSRHSSAAGGIMDDIIASDGDYAGQMVVTIEPGDVLFRTGGCAPFAPAG